MKLSELERWPVFDTPYEVEDGFGTYTEVIAAGADEGAETLPDGSPGMLVAKDEWNEDFSFRRILRIAAIRPR